MNLYLIERPDGGGCDENAGFVIAAPDEAIVRRLAASVHADEGEGVWFDSLRSTVEHIGTALPGATESIVLAHFNAG